MGYVYRILNHPHDAPAEDQRRVWLEAGQWISLGPGLRLTYYVDLYLFRRVFRPRLVLVAGEQLVEMRPVRHDWMDMRAWAPLHMVPIALEEDDAGRPRRIRIQFVRTTPALEWAAA
jgi:hypothetical protein